MACILKRIFAFLAPVETPKSCQSIILQVTKSIIVGGVSLINGATPSSKNQTTAFKKHRENRKTLPFEYRISCQCCQCVKLFLL